MSTSALRYSEKKIALPQEGTSLLPYADTMDSLGTITYGINSTPLSTITSVGSIIAGSMGVKACASGFEKEWNNQRRVEVLAEHTLCGTGYLSNFFSGLSFTVQGVCLIIQRIFIKVKRTFHPFIRCLGSIGIATDIVTGCIFLALDAKTIVKLILELRQAQKEGNEEVLTATREKLKTALLSCLVNAFMLLAVLIFCFAVACGPQIIVALGLIATLAQIYIYRETFKEAFAKLANASKDLLSEPLFKNDIDQNRHVI